MESKIPIKKDEIIGKRVRAVYCVKGPYDCRPKYQPRVFVVKLYSGLQFALEQGQKIIDPVSGHGLIYPYALSTTFIRRFFGSVLRSKGGSGTMKPELGVITSGMRLLSPIKAMYLSDGSENGCALLLENRYVIEFVHGESQDSLIFRDSTSWNLSEETFFELP